MKRFMASLMACACLGLMASCSSDSAEDFAKKHGRPKVQELVLELKRLEPATPPSVLTCQARGMEDSALSDAALWSFLGKPAYEMSKKEKASLAEGGSLWTVLKNCEGNR